MILLNKEQIKYLHSKMIQETGGSNGIRDEGLLDSALSAPFQSFGGMELYPSMIGKGARLCYGLIKNHAFFDGKEAAVKKIYAEILEQQQIEVRQGVMDGLRQAREGKVKDFNAVCDRVEEKYTNAKI